MNLSPLYDRILCKPIDEGHVTKGGLLVPDVAREARALATAEVLSVGAGRVGTDGKVFPLVVKVGDVVLYARRAAQPVPVPQDDGSEVTQLLLREPDVLAVVSGLPRDTGMLDAEGRRLLSWGKGASDEALRAPQVSDRELQSVEQDAKLKEHGWDAGLDLERP